MQFEPALEAGVLIRRYKRFLADIETPEGVFTIHCPNTGSMRACAEPGSRIWYSRSVNPKRKYACTWELVETDVGDLACINTQRANGLVEEAISAGLLGAELARWSLRREVRYGSQNSRVDLLLEKDDARCWIEVKNVTLRETDGIGYFPDAVTARGLRHLQELVEQVEAGDRAMLLFCVAHSGIGVVSPALHIDPTYSDALLRAQAAGVEVVALGADISPERIELVRSLPVKMA